MRSGICSDRRRAACCGRRRLAIGRLRRMRTVAVGRQRPAAGLPAVALLVLVALALGGCSAAATDNNEPNDGLNSATVLVSGTPLDGIIGPDDGDVFQCEAPADDASAGDAARPFVVTVRTDALQDIELQVGASIPGVWEGITWPGWEAVAKGDRLEVAGTLRKGTVLMFLKGAAGTTYSIDIAWE